MTITASANSTPRRHCEAKEKIPGEKKFIAEAISGLVETRDCFGAMRLTKKLKLTELLAMTFRGNCFVAYSQPGLLQGTRREKIKYIFQDVDSFKYAESSMRDPVET